MGSFLKLFAGAKGIRLLIKFLIWGTLIVGLIAMMQDDEFMAMLSSAIPFSDTVMRIVQLFTNLSDDWFEIGKTIIDPLYPAPPTASSQLINEFSKLFLAIIFTGIAKGIRDVVSSKKPIIAWIQDAAANGILIPLAVSLLMTFSIERGIALATGGDTLWSTIISTVILLVFFGMLIWAILYIVRKGGFSPSKMVLAFLSIAVQLLLKVLSILLGFSVVYAIAFLVQTENTQYIAVLASLFFVIIAVALTKLLFQKILDTKLPKPLSYFWD